MREGSAQKDDSLDSFNLIVDNNVQSIFKTSNMTLYLLVTHGYHLLYFLYLAPSPVSQLKSCEDRTEKNSKLELHIFF